MLTKFPSAARWLVQRAPWPFGRQRRVRLGRLDIPAELILMILDHVDLPSRIALSLTCRAFYHYYFPEPSTVRELRAVQRGTLLALLARDENDAYYCPRCVLLHRNHTPWLRRSANYLRGRPNAHCRCPLENEADRVAENLLNPGHNAPRPVAGCVLYTRNHRALVRRPLQPRALYADTRDAHRARMWRQPNRRLLSSPAGVYHYDRRIGYSDDYSDHYNHYQLGPELSPRGGWFMSGSGIDATRIRHY